MTDGSANQDSILLSSTIIPVQSYFIFKSMYSTIQYVPMTSEVYVEVYELEHSHTLSYFFNHWSYNVCGILAEVTQRLIVVTAVPRDVLCVRGKPIV